MQIRYASLRDRSAARPRDHAVEFRTATDSRRSTPRIVRTLPHRVAAEREEEERGVEIALADGARDPEPRLLV